MFKSYTESSPSSASCHDSSPFSPSSSGVSATDSDFSGTCDCTGSVKAHQVCGSLGGGEKACQWPWPCECFYFTPRVFRVNMKPMDELGWRWQEERIEHEREDFNAAKESWSCPISQAPSSGNGRWRRCAEETNPNSDFWNSNGSLPTCSYMCNSDNGRSPLQGRCILDGKQHGIDSGRRLSANSLAGQVSTACQPDLGATHCNCSELKLGPMCSDRAVIEVVGARKKQCDRMQHDYCTRFAGSLLYAAAHHWCHSRDAPGCLDGHRLRSGIRMNMQLQQAGTVGLLLLLTCLVIVESGRLVSQTSRTPSWLLACLLSCHLLFSLILAGISRDLPEVAKQWYFAGCFSHGLPSEIQAQIYLTLQATVDLAFARACFAVAGISVVGLQSYAVQANAGVLLTVVWKASAWVCRASAWLMKQVRRNIVEHLEDHWTYWFFISTKNDWIDWLSISTEKIKSPCESPTAAEETTTVSSTPDSAAKAIAAFSRLLSNKLQHFSCFASVCRHAINIAHVGLEAVLRNATLDHALLLFSYVVTLFVSYLQCEDLWQNAVSLHTDFNALSGSLAGHALPAGHACIHLNSTLLSAMEGSLLAQGTLAQMWM